MTSILLIETATDVCSVGISTNGELVGMEELFIKNEHAAQLQVLVAKVLQKVQLELNQIDAVAISIGPGSYTGLRVGLSAAKGYCFALNIPLIAIGTLDAMAYQASMHPDFKGNGYLIPQLDARRMEVYSGVWNAALQIIEPVSPVILDASSYQKYLAVDTCYVFGSGAEKFKNHCKSAHLVYLHSLYASVKGMAKIAFTHYQENRVADIAYIEPFYLKDFIGTTPKKLF